MKPLLKYASLALGLLFATASYAQVQQSGNVTPGHIATWTSNGIVQDGGTAASSALTSLGVTNNSTSALCVSSGPSTLPGYQQLCLGAPLNGAATISLQNYGTATPQALQLVVNGIPIILPSGSGTFATLTGILAAGNPICANNTSGLLQACSANSWTLVGNPTASTNPPQNFTIGALTNKASPTASDLVMIQDQAAGGALKYATVASVGAVGSVASVNSATGAITVAAGTGISVGTIGGTVTVTNTASGVPVGTILDYAGTSAPTGFLISDGSCVSQATYAALFGVLSTTWGSCSAGLFALPDLRGRLTAAVDSGANRITNAGSGCTATLATGCGTQNVTIAANNVPQLSVAVTDPGHTHNILISSIQSSGSSGFYGGQTGLAGGISQSATTGITATANTSSPNTALTVLNPVLVVNKIIKF